MLEISQIRLIYGNQIYTLEKKYGFHIGLGMSCLMHFMKLYRKKITLNKIDIQSENYFSRSGSFDRKFIDRRKCEFYPSFITYPGLTSDRFLNLF